MLRKWNINDEQTLRQCVDEVITRADEQKGSEFGIIAANEIIDIVANHLDPQVYNLAINDAKKVIETKLADIEIDLDVLQVKS